ncbi:hypothetical protein R0290_29675 [Burkholderia semiarida]|nr:MULTISPECIES: hypothetical protein [Burkholderia]MDN7702642.1 hypothetical protein [Burkholderia sp. AU44665]
MLIDCDVGTIETGPLRAQTTLVAAVRNIIRARSAIENVASSVND